VNDHAPLGSGAAPTLQKQIDNNRALQADNDERAENVRYNSGARVGPWQDLDASI
jgi:hypothetical protein